MGPHRLIASFIERVEKTVLGRLSPDETFDIGMDTGSPVSASYTSPNPYKGRLQKVQIHLEPMDHTESDTRTIRKAEHDTDLARL